MYNVNGVLIKSYRLFDSVTKYVIKSNRKDCCKYDENCVTGSNICIVLDKGMGDFILYSYYLKKTVNYFESTGKKVYILADSYNYEFLKVFFEAEKYNVIILERDTLKLIDGRNLIDFRGNFELALLPVNFLTPRVMQIIRTLSPAKIFSLDKKLFPRNYSVFDYPVFDKVTTFSIKEDFYSGMHHDFFEKLTGLPIDYDILEPSDVDRIEKDDYFVINLEANNKKILLDFNKFIEVGLSIYNKTKLKPVLLGKIEEPQFNLIDKNIFDCRYMGLKDMKATISLCRYSKFVLTGDTGIYHLALSIKDGPSVFVPTWSDKNILFEPYPEYMGSVSERVKYIRMYDSCDKCKEKGLICNTKCILGKQLYCVENLKTSYVVNSILKSMQ